MSTNAVEGWYVVDGVSRYWNGTGWGDRPAEPARPPKPRATLPVVVLAVAVGVAVFALGSAQLLGPLALGAAVTNLILAVFGICTIRDLKWASIMAAVLSGVVALVLVLALA